MRARCRSTTRANRSTRRGHSCYDTTATTTAAADSVSTDQRPTRQLCYKPHVSVREAIDPPLNITLNVLLNEFRPCGTDRVQHKFVFFFSYKLKIKLIVFILAFDTVLY